MPGQNSLRIAGLIFGAWLSWLYAFLADEVNRVYLPGIPLPVPQGGMIGYYGGAILAGMLVGLACSWPMSKWLGAAAGGLIGALAAFIAPWQQDCGLGLQTLSKTAFTITAFIPLVLILIPIALLVRISVELLQTSGLTGLVRRVWLPVLLSGLVAFLGVSRLYPHEVRAAFYSTRALLEEGMNSASISQLPDSLRDVQGFIPNANGRYSMEWSDQAALFPGPQPMVYGKNRNFLIIARYTNGFTVACIFSQAVSQPACANIQ